jgi:hypothetical protein
MRVRVKQMCVHIYLSSFVKDIQLFLLLNFIRISKISGHVKTTDNFENDQ